MKLKFITKLLISSVLASSLNISSFASNWSEDGRYETFEGENITIDNVLEEDTADVEIEGNTLVNEIDYSKIPLLKNGSYTYYNGKVVNTTQNDYTEWANMESISEKIKSDTEYTFYIENHSNFPITVEMRTKKNANTVFTKTLEAGSKNKILFNSGQGTNIYYKHFCASNTNINSTTSIMVLEGDWTNKEIPEYFEGLKSVGQDDVNGHNIEVVSQNKNLFDIDRFVSEYSKIDSNIKKIDEKTVQVIGNNNVNNYKYMLGEFKENTSYTISYNRPIKNFIKAVYTDGSSTQSYTVGLAKFTTDPLKTVSYIKITYQNSGYVNNFSDVQIEEGSVATEYTPYKSNRVQIPLSEPLRGLSDEVKDRIIKKDGKWYVERNCAEVVLDGSESWNGMSYGGLNSETRPDTLYFYKYIDNLLGNTDMPILSDKFAYVSGIYSKDAEGIHTVAHDLNNIRISINKSKLLSESVSGFKQWLSENPLTVVYQLVTPIYEEISIESTVNVYVDTTHISNNSNIPANMKVAVDRVVNRAKEAIERAKNNTTIDNISQARYWSNLMKESILKDSFQDETDNITNVQDLTIERKTESVNTDIYIKMKNIVSLSLDTNSIVFDDVDSTEDTELRNAVNLTVNSSLPYRVNAYLEGDIYNKDKTTTLDKTMLNIKANKDIEYKVFSDALTPVVILDDQEAGEDNTHGVDLKLASSSVKKADIYKASIKFEVVQK